MWLSRRKLHRLLCGTLVLAACTIPRVNTTIPPAETITIEVDNREFADYQVFLIRGGVEIPLGQVEGLTRRTLRVSTALGTMATPIALVAVTTSRSETVRSPVVTVERGQVVSWRVQRASRGNDIIVK